MTSTSSAIESATSSPSATPTGGGGGGNGGPSSPLLFFVALGFGVVFTNLWIIVGVKYCFRYNQRSRARMNGEDPDALDMAAVPRQRRRREKKLMTMDEVNEKFPLVKYKAWRTSRAQEGLPTAGGIASATSRAPSISVERRHSESERERQTNPNALSSDTVDEKIDVRDMQSTETVRKEAPPQQSDRSHVEIDSPTSSAVTMQKTHTNEDDEDEHDRIQTAIPAEHLPDPGDTCAICIDTLEDDDDIRGLICGHAFHASCVDPWLTSRRACCPLCKADYYTPKPRPEGEQEEIRRQRTRVEQAPPSTFSLLAPVRGGRRGRSLLFPSRLFSSWDHNNPQQPERGQPRAHRRPRTTTRDPMAEASLHDPQNPEENRTWRQRMAGIRLPTLPAISRTRNGRGAEPGQQPPTPAQLESGVR